jgi:hypothetical protein
MNDGKSFAPFKKRINLGVHLPGVQLNQTLVSSTLANGSRQWEGPAQYGNEADSTKNVKEVSVPYSLLSRDSDDDTITRKKSKHIFILINITIDLRIKS